MGDAKDPALVALGARVRELREARGMTQSALSTATGLNRVTLSKIEQGHQDLGFLRLIRIASGLQVDLSVLTSGQRELPAEPAAEEY